MIEREYEYRVKAGRVLTRAILFGAGVAYTGRLSGDIGKTRGGILGRLLTVFWP